MSLVQHELSDFLQCELYHTLGSYGVAVRNLRELDERVKRLRRRDTDTTFDAIFPGDALTLVRRYNESLRSQLHRPTAHDDSHAQEARHPDPERRLDGSDVRDRWVLDFYATVISCLQAYKDSQDRKADGHLGGVRQQLGKIIATVDDPQRRGADIGMPVDGRIARTQHRLAVAEALLGKERFRDRAEEVVHDYLVNPGQDQLHTHVLGALIDAHICMHKAEHLKSKNFGQKIRARNELDHATADELRRSLMLNTFVYVVGRAVPWIFAETDDERAFVFENYQDCCDRLSPTYCIWIGSQLSLLALHRRGFTYMLMGQSVAAYNDFLKLRLFARNLRRQLGGSVAKAPGAEAFLMGLDAFADHHSGRIYRWQHAHVTATRHLDRASRGLKALERAPELGGLLRNSRWRIDLLISQAKANYELGHFKPCLRRYAEAWKAFLELADTESRALANYETVEEIIAWLREVEPDTELDKVELTIMIEPLVNQIQMVRGPLHLRILAAEIMMRLGHVLFILRLPRVEAEQVVREAGGEPGAGVALGEGSGRYPDVDHRLAHRCLIQAARLDPWSTLIASDLRKFDYWRGTLDVDDKTGEPVDVQVEQKLAEHWPGGGEFQEAARIVEYVLQCWLSETYDVEHEQEPRKRIARRLLGAFLAHTDSSNVKLAQVYRYLMQESSWRDGSRSGEKRSNRGPSLEVVCLRRYSSFFPFVPRPSAFRVLGGGYLVRIDRGDAESSPFGVAVDPGPHFIDNLYRSGGCLDDVHMIVVTHDHADHMAELDALLALLQYRQKYGATTFGKEQMLCIVGNDSVKTRYDFFNQPGRRDSVKVLTFAEWEAARSGPTSDAALDYVKLCKGLKLERVETVEHRDAGGNVAQGFMLSIHRKKMSAKVLFTSDTGVAPSLGKSGSEPHPGLAGSEPHPGFAKSMRAALDEADVVIAHISSAPLSELRRLAGFDEPPAKAGALKDMFQELWDDLKAQIQEAERDGGDWPRRPRFLLRQLQVGFHSQPTKEREASETHGLEVSPLSPVEDIRAPSERHLYLTGVLQIAECMAGVEAPQLLMIGELREELGTFRTRIASALNADVFPQANTTAVTADIGLKVRIAASVTEAGRGRIKVLCTACELDNDLVEVERLHDAADITEVCVKGENEAIFYNCPVHQPLAQKRPLWIERTERFDPFGR